MEVNGNTILVKRKYNTKDIADYTLKAYNENYLVVNDVAQKLKANTVFETCKNIYDYLIKNVKYVEDQNGQFVKAPGRLVNSGYGDCKSMSVFSASCLRCLNIDHVFRFVSFNDKKEARHVYVVAFDENKEIIIDTGTEDPTFNKEPENMTYSQDIKGPGLYYLSGIPKKTNIGATKKISIWLNNEKETSITIGKQFIYLKIDEFNSLFNITKKSSSKKLYFKELSFWSILLLCYNFVKGDSIKFRRISQIALYFYYNRYFDNISTVEKKGSQQFNEIFENIKHIYSQKSEPTQFDTDISNLIDSEIISKNNLTNYKETPTESIIEKLQEFSPVFSPMFLDAKKLKRASKNLLEKRQKAIEVYNQILQATPYSPEFLKLTFKVGNIKYFGKNTDVISNDEIEKDTRLLGFILASLLIYVGKKLIDRYFEKHPLEQN